jgi:CheY-specific phosphatase CheX
MSLVQKYQKPMMAAISNVLETMFFVIPLLNSNCRRSRSGLPASDFESNIEIRSNSECLRLFFRTTERFARIITANFIGVGEDEVSHEQMKDTMKELANMVSGDFLARLEEPGWGLGVPNCEILGKDARSLPREELIDIEMCYEEEPMTVGVAACAG